MSKQITLKNEQYSSCPECNGQLIYQDRWEELFDRYDVNTPSFQLVLKRLHDENIYIYVSLVT